MSETNPLVEMMRRIRFDIFERMKKGTLNYKRDTATLQKHLQLAQEMNDLVLVGLTNNALGIVNSRMGYLDQAMMYYTQAVTALEKANEPGYLGTLYINIGELHRRAGRYEMALENYQIARAFHQKANKPDSPVLIENNIGLAALALKDYARAKAQFELVLALSQDAPWDHINALIETHNGMAEVLLEAGDFAGAWTHAELAEKLATESDAKISVALTHLTKAHIAERDPVRRHEARDLYTKARQGVRTHGTPLVLARTLIDEARYQQRHGHAEETRRLASEARDMFKSMELASEVALAEELLLSVAKAEEL